MARVFRIDPDGMIVNVMIGFIDLAQGLAAIVGGAQENVHHINAIYVLWIGHDSRVVHRTGIDFVAPLPRGAFIGRAEDAAFAIRGLNSRIDDVGIGGWDGTSET